MWAEGELPHASSHSRFPAAWPTGTPEYTNRACVAAVCPQYNPTALIRLAPCVKTILPPTVRSPETVVGSPGPFPRVVAPCVPSEPTTVAFPDTVSWAGTVNAPAAWEAVTA